MKLALLTATATLALAVPAAADEATLEGYGGDGALLVGIDDSGPKFGNDPAPGRQQPKRDDGNLVAERAPASNGGTQGAAATPTQPSTAPVPTETTTEPARDKKRQQRDERRPDSRDKEPGSSATPAPEPRREPAPLDEEGSSGSSTGLPLDGKELILLLVGLLGLAVIGAGMRRLLVLQPRV